MTWRASVTCGITALGFTLLMVIPTEAGSGSVFISEVMWGGEEYLELFNAGDSTVNLEGWRLTKQRSNEDAEEEIISFESGDHISARGYFLVERAEEATQYAGSRVVSFRLLNSGELLRLIDETGTPIDEANRIGAWFAGSSEQGGYSMERVATPIGEAASWRKVTAHRLRIW